MKFDMHCHTKAGSIDAKIPLERYIDLLKQKGFDGMLVTDHDSYRGYKKWFESGGMKKAKELDFTVLCGIEYDTKDAGHFIVILPDGIMPNVLRLRGLPVEMLIRLVHRLGGILGPAHPFGVKSSSAMFFKKIKEHPEILKRVDFIEAFNTCESSHANEMAVRLAHKYGKPCIGGSDAHEEQYVGMAFTEFQNLPKEKERQRELRQESLQSHNLLRDSKYANIQLLHQNQSENQRGNYANSHFQNQMQNEIRISSNNDLIWAIKANCIGYFGGQERARTTKSKHKEAFYSVLGFKAYNRGLGLLFSPVRKFRLTQLEFMF